MSDGHLGRIVDIVKLFSKDKDVEREDRGDRGDADGGRDREEIMSIDFDKLDHRTVRELQNYVRLQKNTIVHDKD